MSFVDLEAGEFVAFGYELGEISVRTGLRAAAVTRHFGQLLLSKTRANASTAHHAPGEPHTPGTGPGPNVATGDYVRSWSVEFTSIGPTFVAVVGTASPQGARLEYGFYDMTDALGRHFFQVPYPHLGPAFDWVLPQFMTAMSDLGFGAVDVSKIGPRGPR